MPIDVYYIIKLIKQNGSSKERKFSWELGGVMVRETSKKVMTAFASVIIVLDTLGARVFKKTFPPPDTQFPGNLARAPSLRLELTLGRIRASPQLPQDLGQGQ